VLPDRERPRSSAVNASMFSDSGPVLLLPVGFAILFCPREFKLGSFDLGLNLSNCDDDGSDGVGVFVADPDPAELRFGCNPEIDSAGEGFTERLLPFVELWRCVEAIGREVGVEGRETEVGIELTVDVLVLPSDERRDCGRRIPDGIALWLSTLELRVLVIDVGEVLLKEEGGAR